MVEMWGWAGMAVFVVEVCLRRDYVHMLQINKVIENEKRGKVIVESRKSVFLQVATVSTRLLQCGLCIQCVLCKASFRERMRVVIRFCITARAH